MEDIFGFDQLFSCPSLRGLLLFWARKVLLFKDKEGERVELGEVEEGMAGMQGVVLCSNELL
jgi:hypothetical protein